MKILNASLAAGLLLCANLSWAQEPLPPPPDPYPPQDPTGAPATPPLEYGAATAAPPAAPAPPPGDPQFFVAPTDPAAPAVPPPAPAPDLPFPEAPPVPAAQTTQPPALSEIPPAVPPPVPLPAPAPPPDATPVPAAPAPPVPEILPMPSSPAVPVAAPPAPAPTPAPPAVALPPVIAPVPAPLPRPRGPQTLPSYDSAPPPVAPAAPATVITDDTFSDPLYTSIYFGRGSSELSDVSLNKLRRHMPDLLKNIDRYPRLVVELSGHADPSEKGDLQFLSRNRAEIMRALLVSRGVPAERIRISAHGGAKPLRGGGASRDRNSRVEILTYPL